MQELDLSFNKMNGTIPATLGQLSKLNNLNLDGNSWQGVLSEAQLINLTRLQHLTVSTDTVKLLVFNVKSEWDPPFKLMSLELQNCLVGPTFPVWIHV